MGALLELSNDELSRLSELEATIERGLDTFVSVGLALMEVRDSKLYRLSHGTFEDYCRDRWGLERRRAYQLIEAASAVENVNHGTQTLLPSSERQARPLTRLETPEQQREAWDRALEMSPTPTAAVVEEAVREIEGRPKMAVHYSSATDDWATPQALFDLLDAEFSFETDVCASPTNAKCHNFYTADNDGLRHRWEGVCWMNPPYGDVIPEWIAKAHESAGEGATVVCLVPARVDTGWWWDHCRYGEIRFIRGRLKFGGAETSAPFPSAVVIFGPAVTPCVKWWESWPKA